MRKYEKKNYSIKLIMESFLNESTGDALKNLLNNYKFEFYGKYGEVSRGCIDRDFKVFELILQKNKYNEIKNKPVYIPKDVTPKNIDEISDYYDSYLEKNPDAEESGDRCPYGIQKDRHGLKNDGSEKYKLALEAFDEDNPLSPDELRGEPLTPDELAQTGEKQEPYIFGSEHKKDKAPGNGASVKYYSITEGNADEGIEKLNSDELKRMLRLKAERDEQFQEELIKFGALDPFDVAGNTKAYFSGAFKGIKLALSGGVQEDLTFFNDLVTLSSGVKLGDYSKQTFEKIKQEITEQTKAIRAGTNFKESGSEDSSEPDVQRGLIFRGGIEKKLMNIAGIPSVGGIFANKKFVYQIVRHDIKYEKNALDAIFSENVEHPMDVAGKKYAYLLGDIGEIKLSSDFSLEPKLIIAFDSSLTRFLPGKYEEFISGKPDIKKGQVADFIANLDMTDTVSFLIQYGPKGEKLHESLRYGLSRGSLYRQRYRRY